jgi:hypothetical protein
VLHSVADVLKSLSPAWSVKLHCNNKLDCVVKHTCDSWPNHAVAVHLTPWLLTAAGPSSCTMLSSSQAFQEPPGCLSWSYYVMWEPTLPHTLIMSLCPKTCWKTGWLAALDFEQPTGIPSDHLEAAPTQIGWWQFRKERFQCHSQ